MQRFFRLVFAMLGGPKRSEKIAEIEAGELHNRLQSLEIARVHLELREETIRSDHGDLAKEVDTLRKDLAILRARVNSTIRREHPGRVSGVNFFMQ